MRDEIRLIFGDDGKARAYDDTYDVIIHCESEEEQEDVIKHISYMAWIPCSERLPEPRVDVWTCSDIGQIQGYYEENVGIWYASFGQGRDYLELYVTAWMPLPEPYREE